MRGVRSGVGSNAGCAKEGVAIMLNKVCFRAVVGSDCVSSRMLWVKFTFARVKLFWLQVWAV